MNFEKVPDDLPNVVLIDGAWGSGKSLVGHLVSSLEAHSPFRIDQTLEFLSIATRMGKVSEDAYRQGVLARIVECHYNNLIGREINLRFDDDSSFLKSLGWGRSLKLLNSKLPEDIWQSSINRGDVYVQLTHLLGFDYQQIFDLFAGRVKIVTVRRNPLYLVEHWRSYFEKFDRPRELTPSFRIQGHRIPYFAESWAQEWIESNSLERAIRSISAYQQAEAVQISRHAERVVNPDYSGHLSVFFGQLISQPNASLAALERFLGTGSSSRTQRTLKINGLTTGSSSRHFVRPENSEGKREELLSKIQREADGSVFEMLLEAERRFLSEEGKCWS